MVRNRKQTDRKRLSDDDMREAVSLVINKTETLSAVATKFGLAKSTLFRAVHKEQDANKRGTSVATFKPNHGHHRVFTDKEEQDLVDYILEASKIHQGMTKKMVREFAYQWASSLNKKHPPTWSTNTMAGMWHLKQYLSSDYSMMMLNISLVG